MLCELHDLGIQELLDAPSQAAGRQAQPTLPCTTLCLQHGLLPAAVRAGGGAGETGMISCTLEAFNMGWQ